MAQSRVSRVGFSVPARFWQAPVPRAKVVSRKTAAVALKPVAAQVIHRAKARQAILKQLQEQLTASLA